MQENSKVTQLMEVIGMIAGAVVSIVLAVMCYEAGINGEMLDGSGRKGRAVASLLNLIGDVLEPIGGLLIVSVILGCVGLFLIYQTVKQVKHILDK